MLQASITTGQESSFNFAQGRQRAIRYLKRLIDQKESEGNDALNLRQQLLKVKALKTYPIDSGQLVKVGIVPKAKILKSHLREFFPNTHFSVKCDFYSGGTTIEIFILDGETPEGIESITSIYMDKGSNKNQPEYDNVVETNDMRKKVKSHATEKTKK